MSLCIDLRRLPDGILAYNEIRRLFVFADTATLLGVETIKLKLVPAYMPSLGSNRPAESARRMKIGSPSVMKRGYSDK